MYFKSRIFNSIANNTRETKNLCENSFLKIKFMVIIYFCPYFWLRKEEGEKRRVNIGISTAGRKKVVSMA